MGTFIYTPVINKHRFTATMFNLKFNINLHLTYLEKCYSYVRA